MTIRTETRIRTQPMVGRATATPVDRQFRAALGDGASVLLGGVESAARALPGGEIVAAAVHGTARSVGASSSRSGSSGIDGSTGGASAALTAAGETSDAPGYQGLLGGGNESMELIELQQQIQEENRRYSTLSNVLKARHETAKNAIGNIR